MVITVRNEVAKVMFLQASVCPRGGGVPGRVGVLVPGVGGAWSGGCLLPRGLLPGGVVGIPACTEADTPQGEMATAADGTHPTGMHSC